MVGLIFDMLDAHLETSDMMMLSFFDTFFTIKLPAGVNFYYFEVVNSE